MLRWKSVVCALVAWLGLQGSAVADVGACDQLAGNVVFMDTVYGVATGLLLGGVALALSDDGDTKDYLVSGSAVGASLGLGLGIAEVVTRDCDVSKKRIEIRSGYLPGGKDRAGGFMLGFAKAI